MVMKNLVDPLPQIASRIIARSLRISENPSTYETAENPALNPFNWVAVKELKLSYHNGYIYICILHK